MPDERPYFCCKLQCQACQDVAATRGEIQARKQQQEDAIEDTIRVVSHLPGHLSTPSATRGPIHWLKGVLASLQHLPELPGTGAVPRTVLTCSHTSIHCISCTIQRQGRKGAQKGHQEDRSIGPGLATRIIALGVRWDRSSTPWLSVSKFLASGTARCLWSIAFT